MPSMNGTCGQEEQVAETAENLGPPGYQYKPKRPWSFEEDKKFFEELAKQQGRNVTDISNRIAKLIPTRTAEQVRQRYYRAVKHEAAQGRPLPQKRAARPRAPANTGSVPSAAGPALGGALPPPAAWSARQQHAEAAEQRLPGMLQQKPAVRQARSTQQGAARAGSHLHVAPIVPAQQVAQGGQPGACAQQHGQEAAAGKLEVEYWPRDSRTEKAVQECGESAYWQLPTRPTKRVRSALTWLEQQKWPRAAQRLSGSLHLFPPRGSALAAQSLCWGQTSDAALTMGDLHQAYGCPPVLKLEYAWMQAARAGGAAQHSCSVQQVQAEKGRVPPASAPGASRVAKAADESNSQQHEQPRAPVVRLRLPGGAAPLPRQGNGQEARTLPALAPSQQPQPSPLPALAAAPAVRAMQAAAAVQQQQQRSAVQQEGTAAMKQAQAAHEAPAQEAAREPLRKKPRRIQAARVSPRDGAACVHSGAAEQVSAGGQQPHEGEQHLPGSGMQSLLGGQNTCEAFQAAWGLGSLPAAAPQKPASQAVPASHAGMPAAPTSKEGSRSTGRPQRKNQPKTGKGRATTAKPARQRARAQPVAEQANGAAEQPALHSILCGGEGSGSGGGDMLGGEGERTCDAFEGAWAVGDAPTSFAGISRLASRAPRPLPVNAADFTTAGMPGSDAPQRTTPSTGARRRRDVRQEEATPPAGKKRQRCTSSLGEAGRPASPPQQQLLGCIFGEQTLAGLAEGLRGVRSADNLSRLPDDLPADLPSPSALGALPLASPQPTKRAAPAPVPLPELPLESVQLEALSCREQSFGFCKSLLGAGADSWLAADASPVQQPAAPTPSSRPFAALFGA